MSCAPDHNHTARWGSHGYFFIKSSRIVQLHRHNPILQGPHQRLWGVVVACRPYSTRTAKVPPNDQASQSGLVAFTIRQCTQSTPSRVSHIGSIPGISVWRRIGCKSIDYTNQPWIPRMSCGKQLLFHGFKIYVTQAGGGGGGGEEAVTTAGARTLTTPLTWGLQLLSIVILRFFKDVDVGNMLHGILEGEVWSEWNESESRSTRPNRNSWGYSCNEL